MHLKHGPKGAAGVTEGRAGRPLSLLLAALVASAAVDAAAEPLASPVDASAVALMPDAPGETRIGRLVYRGGLLLRSADRRLGGWSALAVSANGRSATLVSDRGRWLTARLGYDGAGRLAGLAVSAEGVLADTAGHPVTEGGVYSDAESLAPLPDGGSVVGFEQVHRLWLYPPGAPPFRGPGRRPTTAWRP